MQSSNGQTLPQPDRSKPKRHTAKHCPFAIRERIVNALANGDSKRAIARAFRVSNNTVDAVAEQDWQRVAARKAKLAARYEKLADLYTERQIDELQSGAKIPLNLCQSGGGIATDKVMALRGEPSLTIQHNVTLEQQNRDLEFIQVLRNLNAQAEALLKAAGIKVPERVHTNNPRQTELINALNNFNGLVKVREKLAQATVVDVPALKDASVAGESAAQKES